MAEDKATEDSLLGRVRGLERQLAAAREQEDVYRRQLAEDRGKARDAAIFAEGEVERISAKAVEQARRAYRAQATLRKIDDMLDLEQPEHVDLAAVREEIRKTLSVDHDRAVAAGHRLLADLELKGSELDAEAIGRQIAMRTGPIQPPLPMRLGFALGSFTGDTLDLRDSGRMTQAAAIEFGRTWLSIVGEKYRPKAELAIVYLSMPTGAPMVASLDVETNAMSGEPVPIEETERGKAEATAQLGRELRKIALEGIDKIFPKGR
jgi:hypothetical protein